MLWHANMSEEIAKPQPTLKGYAAWAFKRLVEAKGTGPAQVSGWIMERWIDENGKLLREEFGISREQFRRQGKVVQHPHSRA